MAKSEKDQTPEIDAAKQSSIIKSQANYKGNSMHDLVEVEIIADGSFYKKGDKDKVHPSLAEILKQKGLIKGYKGAPKSNTEEV